MEQFSPNRKENESGREQIKTTPQKHSSTLHVEEANRKRVSVRSIIDDHYRRNR
ncbi:hypothetical protein [uncultured Roseivirga sp.]|uniref:hypothetical protein n=1 Tax=uncultured Roseivirga sp. TaxID=543088 RepID=UPI0030DCA50F|tara:strand:- start:220 stop:381 length:162 start_codon:yes stop_codon:yes gene_type:complete